MRGVYTVRTNISLSTAKTVLLGTLPAGTLIELLEVKLTNSDQKTHEQMHVGIFPVTTLGSPVGTSITAGNVQPTEPGAGNTSVTWLANLSAEPSTYNSNPYDSEGVPNEVGYHYEPVPEARQWVGSGMSFGLRLLTTLTNAINAEAIIKYRELN